LTDTSIRTQAFKAIIPSLDTPYPRIQELSPGDGDGAGIHRAKLATVLAVMTRQAHAIGSGVPNQYVQAMEGVRELEALSAVVYSSNFDVGDEKYGLADVGPQVDTSKPDIENMLPTPSAGTGPSSEAAKEKEQDANVPPTSVSSSTANNSGWGLFENVWGRVSGSSAR
jgi:hypothetical protein